MPLGLTKENVSSSALGIGAAVGLGVGSILVPLLLQSADLMSADFVWEQGVRASGDFDLNQTAHAIFDATNIIADPLAVLGSNETVALAAAAASALPTVHAKGYLGTYLHALRHFPCGVLYSDWCTVLVTVLLLLTIRLIYNCANPL